MFKLFNRKRKIKDKDTWNVDYKIVEFALPLIKRFKELKNGYPTELGSMEKWDEILDKIIWSMEEVVSLDEGLVLTGNNEIDRPVIKEYFKKQQEGFELFGKYFQNLWW